MTLDNNQQVFFALLRAGLWEQDVWLLPFGSVDYSVIMRLAEEQSVVGLITAGLEHVVDVKVPKEVLLQFIGSTLQIEQQNKAMNEFVAQLVNLLRKNDVYTLLVKGQGIAQCYERPLWRSSGDVDLFLSDNNYEMAKRTLVPLASCIEKEYHMLKHLGMTIKGFQVELHGTLRSRLTKRIDEEIDKGQNECFFNGEVRSWLNGNTQVFLPGANQDIVFVFTHILHHLFIEGIGLRQICDWCRLLWTYQDKINQKKLEVHLQTMGLMTEWKVLGALAVEYLGMDVKAMPFYDSGFSKKASRIMAIIMETGNFGHNLKHDNDNLIKTINRRTLAAFKMMRIFPIDAWKMYFGMIRTGLVFRRE